MARSALLHSATLTSPSRFVLFFLLNVQPQPSLGSLPQLAADLLIHTLDFQLVGYLALRDTIPAVSGLDGVEGQDVGEGISFGVEGAYSLLPASCFS